MIGEMSESGPVYLTAKGTAPRLRGSVAVRKTKYAGKVTGLHLEKAFERFMQHRWLAANLSLGPSLVAGLVTPLNDMAQGTANAQRLANQTRFESLEYALQPGASCNAGWDAIRMFIFQDTQPEGALPTITQLLCASNPYSCFNPDLVGNQARPRFRILANHLVTGNNTTPFTTSSTYFGFPIVTGHLRLGFTTTYEGDAGTVSDIQTNGLFLAVISSGTLSNVAGNYCLKYIQ